MGQTVMLRNSERKAYKRCRQKWDWSYNHGLERMVKSPALRFGTLVHEALAAYYIPGTERGPHPAETFRDLYEEELEEASEFGFRDEDDKWHDAYELGVVLLEEYVEEYEERDALIEIISPEQPFQVDLYNPKNGRYVCTLVGTVDAIIRDLKTGDYGFFEHKTAKTIRTEHLQLDDQAGTYWAVADEILEQQGIDIDLSFILYNFLRKGKPDKRPQNSKGHYLNKPTKNDLLGAAKSKNLPIPKNATVASLTNLLERSGVDPAQLGEVSKSQPPPLFKRVPVYRDEYDRQQMLQRIVNEAWEMKQVRRGKLPIYKNPTQDCSWDCDFHDVCELHETGADYEELMEFVLKPWDPYADHRDPEDPEAA